MYYKLILFFDIVYWANSAISNYFTFIYIHKIINKKCTNPNILLLKKKIVTSCGEIAQNHFGDRLKVECANQMRDYLRWNLKLN